MSGGDEFSTAIVEPDIVDKRAKSPAPGAASARIVPTDALYPPHQDEPIIAALGVPPVVASRPENDFFVEFGPVGYVAMWCNIYALHIISAGYFIAAGILYKALPVTSVAGNLELYSLIIPLTYFPTIAVFHYLVAVVHFRFLISPVVQYLYKKLTTRGVKRMVKKVERRVSLQVKTHVTDRLERSVSSRHLHHQVKNVFRYTWALFFARSGFFGVEGNYFETLFLIRETVETTLQSYQAYQMSRLLPRKALNRFYVVVLIVNCWSTPLLSKFVKHKPLQRLLCMFSDILLDFISSVWVPVYLAVYYIQLYDPETTDLKGNFWYEDDALVRIMNESPIILFGSAIDAISRLMFSISMVSSMEDVKALIQKRRPDLRHLQQVQQRPVTGPSSTATSAVQSSLVVKSSLGTQAKAMLLKGALQRQRIISWGHRIMTVFGVIVLIVQIQAESKIDTPSCVMELRPWLVSQRACALIEINCHTNPELTGNLSNFETIFGDLDPKSLEHVVYRHCPEIEFGPELQKFEHLLGMKVYNSTISRWDDDAALTNTNHPNIVFAFYVYTLFPNASLPPGLLSFDHPKLLKDMEFVDTNLDNLPDDLPQRWPKGLNVFVERSAFTVFPDELALLDTVAYTFCGNQLTDLTQIMLDKSAPGFGSLFLSGNPITHISESLDVSTSVITYFALDSTNLSSIPLWMDELFFNTSIVRASGAPICTDVLLQVNDTATQQLLAERPYLSEVRCNDIGFRNSFYPLDGEIRESEVW